jgi:hypothetical protein
MEYSLPVRWIGLPSTVNSRLSRLSCSGPTLSVGWLKPLLRRTTACSRASSSALSKGLVKKSSAPIASPFTLACGRESPDRIRTGVSIRAARMRRTTSYPSMSGNIRSRMTAS